MKNQGEDEEPGGGKKRGRMKNQGEENLTPGPRGGGGDEGLDGTGSGSGRRGYMAMAWAVGTPRGRGGAG